METNRVMTVPEWKHSKGEDANPAIEQRTR